MQRRALFSLFGTLFIVLEPALVLFTVGLTVVGVVALITWLVYVFVTLRDATAYGNLYGSYRWNRKMKLEVPGESRLKILFLDCQ